MAQRSSQRRTVSKAYAEAEQRGLISASRARHLRAAAADGSAGLAPRTRPINLALKRPATTGEDEVIGAMLAEIVRHGEIVEPARPICRIRACAGPRGDGHPGSPRRVTAEPDYLFNHPWRANSAVDRASDGGGA